MQKEINVNGTKMWNSKTSKLYFYQKKKFIATALFTTSFENL